MFLQHFSFFVVGLYIHVFICLADWVMSLSDSNSPLCGFGSMTTAKTSILFKFPHRYRDEVGCSRRCLHAHKTHANTCNARARARGVSWPSRQLEVLESVRRACEGKHVRTCVRYSVRYNVHCSYALASARARAHTRHERTQEDVFCVRKSVDWIRKSEAAGRAVATSRGFSA